MGLLDDTTHKQYYEGDDYGNYQFTSLNDIITQFQIAYVGENKIIPKVKRADIAFHAQRALQELSFDTFKSIKSQQIELKDTLQMILPHDYVNYTKISWTDGSGIKHPLYPTKHTSNPFQVRQDDAKDYYFDTGENIIVNGDFSTDPFGQGNWDTSAPGESGTWSAVRVTGNNREYPDYLYDEIARVSGDALQFKHYQRKPSGSHSYGVYQKLDIRGMRYLDLKATGTSATQQTSSGGTAGDIAGYGVLRIGLTTTDPATGLKVDGSIGWADTAGDAITVQKAAPFHATFPSPNYNPNNIDLGYVEWNDGSTYEQELTDIDVTTHDYVWIYIQSFVPFTAASITAETTWDHDSDASTAEVTTKGRSTGDGGFLPASAATGNAFNNNTTSENEVTEISIATSSIPNTLMNANADGDSDTWNDYKATTPSENNNDDYKDDTYWPANGERYGLDPQHAQANGSFFIDDRTGLIHFSSNVSGKAVILDYISDSLGTDDEMKVHKFAEEAMYKSIAYAILSTSTYGQPLVPRFKKERFAAIRQAKLRLSNIKLEELTQTLRGKSKHIKH